MGQHVDVLVVDDSAFFRNRIIEVLEQSSKIRVIDTAVNGQEAVEKAFALKPDVITMDVEMPVLNGIEAVKQIMAQNPVPILMFSSLTSEGAKVTFDALEAGAVDYLSKNFSPSSTYDEAYVLLREKVTNIALKTNRLSFKRSPNKTPELKSLRQPVQRDGIKNKFNLVVIGASTGGPVALQEVLTKLPATFSLPIVVLIHMPSQFTQAYADRLNTFCKVKVKQAEDGDLLKPGEVLLAPGGMQLLIEKKGNRSFVEIKESLPEQLYKPSVDVGFASAAKSFGKSVLAVVLTGMGSDGKMGAQKLKQEGATVWSQDQDSCVVYGMPQAVEKAGLSDKVLPIEMIGSQLVKAI